MSRGTICFKECKPAPTLEMCPPSMAKQQVSDTFTYVIQFHFCVTTCMLYNSISFFPNGDHIY